MRVLLIKTSSMGDIIHTFPALTDAGNAIPGITFDWVVEEAFADIPTWHPLVKNVIPVALRRWRKGVFTRKTWSGWRKLRKAMNAEKYDLVLDAQGLVKSALVTFNANGKRAGLDWGSARESLASLAYQQKHTVNFYQHAVVRMRQLFSLALGYPMPAAQPDFGLDATRFTSPEYAGNYLLFLHGTTWVSKQWPTKYWVELAEIGGAAGFQVKMAGGNPAELACAQEIAAATTYVDALPRLPIKDIAKLIAGAKGVVAVDTGFGHLAGALGLPTVSIYGPTNPEFTGALGKQSVCLGAEYPCSPCLARHCKLPPAGDITPACYTTIPPLRVWAALRKMLA